MDEMRILYGWHGIYSEDYNSSGAKPWNKYGCDTLSKKFYNYFKI
jgi:hypothetical protein